MLVFLPGESQEGAPVRNLQHSKYFILNSAHRRFQFTGNRQELSNFTQSLRGHIMVYAFILAGMHLIGFMPNAHIPTTPYFLIKVLPRGIMQPVPIFCISFKMFKRSPILYDSAQTKFGTEKSCLITAF